MNSKEFCLAVCAFVLTLSIPGILSAQGQPSFGVTGGLQFSDVAIDADGRDLETSPHFGATLGAVASVPMTSAFSFQPELVYTRRGYNVSAENMEGNPDTGNAEGEVKNKLNYLQVPLLASFKLGGDAARFVPKLLGGPYLGAFMGGETETDVTFTGPQGQTVSSSGSSDIDDDQVTGLDFGLTVGVGATIELARGKLTGSLRFQYGLTNIDDSDSTSIDSIRNMELVGLHVGYLF